MSELKVGDKVRIPPDCAMWFDEGIEVGYVIGVDGDEFEVGQHPTDRPDDDCSWCYDHDYELIKEEKTMDNLVVGDVLVDSDGDKCKVLAVLAHIVALSDYNDYESFGYWRTEAALKRDWKLENEQVKEMTVGEVEKLVGQKVKIVK
jgi:hypothetical protein